MDEMVTVLEGRRGGGGGGEKPGWTTSSLTDIDTLFVFIELLSIFECFISSFHIWRNLIEANLENNYEEFEIQ